jgi:hypothetical protein
MRFSKGVIGFEYLPVSKKLFIKINGMLKEINF